MTLPSRLLTLLFLYSIASSLLASETGYEVELIIFEDANARYIQSEDWGYNDMLNNIKEEKIENETTKDELAIDSEYTQLIWEGAKLSTQLERLSKNNNYRVLAVKRWKQTGLDREHAFNISIKDNEPVITQDSNNAKILDLNEKIDTENDPELDTDETETLELTPYLIGDVKLIMSRYLHFNLNLQYIKPLKSQNGEIENKVFPVISERRMRSKEVHYIDHPLVGVVVLATPYKIESMKKQMNEESLRPDEYKTM